MCTADGVRVPAISVKSCRLSDLCHMSAPFRNLFPALRLDWARGGTVSSFLISYSVCS